MTLKEKIHRSIDDLDNCSLTLIYEHIQQLRREKDAQDTLPPAPSIEEVLELTSSMTGSWSDDMIADRIDRV